MYELDDCMDEQMNRILNAWLIQNIKPPVMLVKQVCMHQQSQPALVSGQCHSVVTVPCVSKQKYHRLQQNVNNKMLL